LKDYYTILNVPVTATVPEIKQAYRKLVMIYHPDKNNQEPYSMVKFNEIKEAYETLINPRKKEAYLQERWLSKARGQTISQDMITAPNILIKSLELNKAIAVMDVYRMDYDAIAARISSLLNNDVIAQLLALKETGIHQSIINTLLKATAPLPYNQTREAVTQLRILADTHPALIKKIEQVLQQKKQKEFWMKLKNVLILLLTILICLLIYFANN